jgi:hypothetical protein
MIRKYLLSTCLGLSLVTSLALTAQAGKDDDSSDTPAAAADRMSTPTDRDDYASKVTAFDKTSAAKDSAKDLTSPEQRAQELIDAVMTDRKNHGYVYHAATYPENYKKVIDSAKGESPEVQRKVAEKLMDLAKERKIFPKVKDMLTHALHLAKAPVIQAKDYEAPEGGLAGTSSTQLLKEDAAMEQARAIISKILMGTNKKEFYSLYYEDIIAASKKEKNPQLRAAILAQGAVDYHKIPMLQSVATDKEPGKLYGWKTSTFRWTEASQGAQDKLAGVFGTADKNEKELTIARKRYANNPEKQAFEDKVVDEVKEGASKSSEDVTRLRSQLAAGITNIKSMIGGMESHLSQNHEETNKDHRPLLNVIKFLTNGIKNDDGGSFSSSFNVTLLKIIREQANGLPEDLGEDGHKSHFFSQCDAIEKNIEDLKEFQDHHSNVHKAKVDEISEILPHRKAELKGAIASGKRKARAVSAEQAQDKSSLSDDSGSENPLYPEGY